MPPLFMTPRLGPDRAWPYGANPKAKTRLPGVVGQANAKARLAEATAIQERVTALHRLRQVKRVALVGWRVAKAASRWPHAGLVRVAVVIVERPAAAAAADVSPAAPPALTARKWIAAAEILLRRRCVTAGCACGSRHHWGIARNVAARRAALRHGRG